MSKPPVLIIGAGLAGLSIANQLEKRQINYRILEKNTSPGGLARSIEIGDYSFDYTGHFLNLTRHQHPRQLERIHQGQWKKLEIQHFTRIQGEIVPAPFQFNLGKFSRPLRKQFLDSYLARTPLDASIHCDNPLDYFYRTFGEAMTDSFFVPYTEKISDCLLQNHSMEGLHRLFPQPDHDLLMKGALPETPVKNASLWYPETCGIQQLVNNMLPEQKIELGQVEHIDLHEKVVQMDGREIPFQTLFSSASLKSSLSMMGNSYEDAESIASRLEAVSVIAIQVGVRGAVPEMLRNRHWIYFPDPNIPFHRVGIYSNINPHLSPKRCYNLYAEVAVSDIDAANLTEVEMQTLNALENLELINKSQVEVSCNLVLRDAYVTFDAHWESHVPKTLEKLKTMGYYGIGRWGTWNYGGMEDAIVEAQQIFNSWDIGQ